MCVCGLQEIVNELDRVLVLDTSSQLLSYDTTFKLGDFYVSPLIFRHTLFKETPCIPAMFLIHEHNKTVLSMQNARHCWRTHDQMQQVQRVVPWEDMCSCTPESMEDKRAMVLSKLYLGSFLHFIATVYIISLLFVQLSTLNITF